MFIYKLLEKKREIVSNILTFRGDQELHMIDASSSKRLCKKTNLINNF